MTFNVAEFFDDLLGDPAALQSRSVADPATAGGGCRSESSEPIRASERENTPERPSRLPCVERGAVGRTLGGGQSTTAISADERDTDTVNLRRDAVDRAAIEYCHGLRFGGPIVAERVTTEPIVVNGTTIPAGWSRDRWREELSRMACRCERIRPDRSRVLRRDAERLAKSGVDNVPLMPYTDTGET